MKKIISVFLAVIIVTALAAVPAFADDLTIEVSTASAAPGGTVTVNFTISGNPGIAAYSGDIVFDESMLELKSIASGKTLALAFMSYVPTRRVAGFSAYDATQDGLLFQATFNVKSDIEEGLASVDFQVSEMLNENYVEYSPSVISGGVEVNTAAEPAPGEDPQTPPAEEPPAADQPEQPGENQPEQPGEDQSVPGSDPAATGDETDFGAAANGADDEQDEDFVFDTSMVEGMFDESTIESAIELANQPVDESYYSDGAASTETGDIPETDGAAGEAGADGLPANGGAGENGGSGASPVVWIVVAGVVLCAAAAGIFLAVKGKKKSQTKAAEATEDSTV